jgi:hypothetical protein
MMGLTPKQARLLAFLRSEALAGRRPTLDRMASYMGQGGRCTSHRMVGELVDRGYIRRVSGRRAYDILRPDGTALRAERLRFIPVSALTWTEGV